VSYSPFHPVDHLYEFISVDDKFQVHCKDEYCHNLIDSREYSCIYCGLPQYEDSKVDTHGK
jgi:hypothetical protein